MDSFWPERPPSVWLPELSLALLLVGFSIPGLLLTFVLAFICRYCGLLALMRFLRTRRAPRYWRDPASCRVAIVGAGWSGLAIAARLQELGVPFTGFEALDDVGGTWHPSRHYPGLALHTPAYGATFEGFPYPSGEERDATPDHRPSAAQVYAYVRRFAEALGLLRHFVFSTRVASVTMDERSRTATLTLQHEAGGPPAGSDRPQLTGPFDMVVYASVTARPFVPPLLGKLEGECCHACELTAQLAARASRARWRVVVVGAGKSACDMVLALLDAGVQHERLTWLVRRPYYFWKLERCWHRCSERNQGRWIPRMRAFGAAIAFWMCDVAPWLGWRLFWALDYVFTPHSNQPSKWCSDPPFHMGLLDATQRRRLAEVRQLLGEPVHLDGKFVALKDGGRLEADLLVWATGYRTGAAELRLHVTRHSAVNGGAAPCASCCHVPIATGLTGTAPASTGACCTRGCDSVTHNGASSLDVSTVSDGGPLFEHMLPPHFPVLALASHFLTAPGPQAAREAAEYLVYHMCVRQPLAFETMHREASVQHCKQSSDRHLLFSSGFLQNVVQVQDDLCSAAIIPLWTAMVRIADIFIFNRVTTRELGLLPRHDQTPRQMHGLAIPRASEESEPLV
ncbi:hypothetical protein AB1Y20_002298 [Prymnesium parvum]|uniref:L-ornithine N(5)-oxygenase n=1 Tax=Prymnesium parvum TaxID=97485 RepID=A0AB34J8Z3_PRYPA